MSQLVVTSVLDSTHLRCAKLLGIRTREGADAKLPAGSFIELFQRENEHKWRCLFCVHELGTIPVA